LNITDYPVEYQVIMAAFAGSFVLQMIYWWVLHARIIYYTPGASSIRKSPVSVIICARNEEENLRNNLPRVLGQDYPEFEVIVVDDGSGDGTPDLLRDLRQEYPHLRTTRIEESTHARGGKKLALTVGLKAARYDWVLLTDADCSPAGDTWLARMQKNFSKDTGIVLGYGGYRRTGGLLNLVIRYDTFFIALQYLGYALAGIPYMGIGRNLAYRKEIFFRNRGFANHYELVSGDDDLFINEVARHEHVRIEISPASHTVSEPARTWKEWYYQKKRHLTTGPRYRPLTKFLLGVEIISRILFYALFIFLAASLIVRPVLLPFLLPVFIIRVLSTIVIIKLAMTRLNERYLLLFSPVLDFALPWAHIYMAFSNYVALKRARWT
jgi:cellulose synthase/poly-beta-1,6-N-acetylglucosamine synthase-like glycosyltransferase